jgi:predicted O-methyltransferase YrrM
VGGITAKQMLTLRWVHWLNRRRFTLGTVSSAELYYQAIFDTAVARSGLDVPPLFPIGSAANYSLLYLIFRLLRDFPRLGILELGAGQSTILLAAMHRAGLASAITTLEHDPGWAEAIRDKVGHQVLVAPLRQESILGVMTECYEVELTGRFDCILVDGPIGTPRQSRWGALQLLQQNLAEDFIVIFDDAERPGERDTIERFLLLHPSAEHSFIHAAKSQCIVFTGKYRLAGSYSDR